MPVSIGGRPTNVSSSQRKISPIVKQTLLRAGTTATYYSGVSTISNRNSCNRKSQRTKSVFPGIRTLGFFRVKKKENDGNQAETNDNNDDNNNNHKEETKTRGPTPPQKRILLRKQKKASSNGNHNGNHDSNHNGNHNADKYPSDCTVSTAETVKWNNRQNPKARNATTTTASTTTTTSTSFRRKTTTTSGKKQPIRNHHDEEPPKSVQNPKKKRNLKKSILLRSISDKHGTVLSIISDPPLPVAAAIVVRNNQ